jgi:hypothetical protein
MSDSAEADVPAQSFQLGLTLTTQHVAAHYQRLEGFKRWQRSCNCDTPAVSQGV